MLPVSAVPTRIGHGGRRRLAPVMAMAMVLAIAGSFLVLSSQPASAATQQEAIAKARSDALVALQRPKCRSYLTGPAARGSNSDPAAVLTTASIDAKPIPAGLGADSVASSPLGGGLSSTIAAYPLFFDDSRQTSVLTSIVAVVPQGALARTATILHEVGHLTGREGDHNNNPARQIAYNTDIVNRCLSPQTPPGSPLRISGLDCSLLPLAQGVVCYAYWTGGADPAKGQWISRGAATKPIVKSDPVAQVTTAYFDCYDRSGGLGEPFERTELSIYTTVTVTDAAGAKASLTATPCPW